MRKIDTIIVHCSATPPEMDIGADEIREWHKAKGWDDIGYHFVIRRNGIVEIGRPVHKFGAHAKGHNKGSIGVCLIGGNNKADFTFEQYNQLNVLVNGIKNMCGIKEVLGHCDLPGVTKLCPCFDVKSFFN